MRKHFEDKIRNQPFQLKEQFGEYSLIYSFGIIIVTKNNNFYKEMSLSEAPIGFIMSLYECYKKHWFNITGKGG